MTALKMTFTVAALLSSAACATANRHAPIEYTARPGQIADPRGELKALVLSNPRATCIEAVDFPSKEVLSIRSACTDGAQTDVVRFDRVSRIFLERVDGRFHGYVVKVDHNQGSEQFIWPVTSLEDARHFADALAALAIR